MAFADMLWKLFETSGSVEAYIGYNAYIDEKKKRGMGT